jgi:small subunit ribosomal protein S16
MSVKIRLRREGRKGQPSYRIVVAHSESPRDGRFVDMLGHYFPRNKKGAQYDVDVARAKEWLSKGATPSETVQSILKQAGCFGSDMPKPPVSA